MNQTKTDLGIVNESQLLRFGIKLQKTIKMARVIVQVSYQSRPEAVREIYQVIVMAAFGHVGVLPARTFQTVRSLRFAVTCS